MEKIDPKVRKALWASPESWSRRSMHRTRSRPRACARSSIAPSTAGVHMLVANGNTGEFYGLTMPEAEAMVNAAAEIMAAGFHSSEAWDAALETPAHSRKHRARPGRRC